jgi:hypothetical protein
MNGRTLAHHHITAKLGQAPWAKCAAPHTKLRREVAIKILPLLSWRALGA